MLEAGACIAMPLEQHMCVCEKERETEEPWRWMEICIQYIRENEIKRQHTHIGCMHSPIVGDGTVDAHACTVQCVCVCMCVLFYIYEYAYICISLQEGGEVKRAKERGGERGEGETTERY